MFILPRLMYFSYRVFCCFIFFLKINQIKVLRILSRIYYVVFLLSVGILFRQNAKGFFKASQAKLKTHIHL